MILLLMRARVWMTSFFRVTIGKYIQSILGAHTQVKQSDINHNIIKQNIKQQT